MIISPSILTVEMGFLCDREVDCKEEPHGLAVA